MKSWTTAEFRGVIAALKPLLGLRLQEVQTSTEDVVLGFYSSAGLLWLWIDLTAARPSVLPWIDLPRVMIKKKTPLHLFLQAHFVGRSLNAIYSDESAGRVATLNFGEGRTLELRLFPHARNILATSEEKSLAWQKPRDLAPGGSEPASATPRDLEQLRQEWLAVRGGSLRARQKPVSVKDQLTREIQKKEKALLKVREELARKLDQPWKEVGAWLKAHQNVDDVPPAFEPFVDKRRKLAWNIEQCFAKAHEVESKVQGTREREQVLLRNLHDLRTRLDDPNLKSQTLVSPTKSEAGPSLGKMKATGRTLHLEGGLRAVAGKSAADNMKILRQARAWDLWFHLRDYPSSHAVLFRNKNKPVSDAVLRQVALWFVRTHFGAKATDHSGEKFDLVVAECRYVKTIKGDKLGRVTYHDERVLIVQLP